MEWLDRSLASLGSRLLSRYGSYHRYRKRAKKKRRGSHHYLHETKVGKTGLRMSSGEIRRFSSPEARDRFERVARAIRHGWVPPVRNPDLVGEESIGCLTDLIVDGVDTDTVISGASSAVGDELGRDRGDEYGRARVDTGLRNAWGFDRLAPVQPHTIRIERERSPGVIKRSLSNALTGAFLVGGALGTGYLLRGAAGRLAKRVAEGPASTWASQASEKFTSGALRAAERHGEIIAQRIGHHMSTQLQPTLLGRLLFKKRG